MAKKKVNNISKREIIAVLKKKKPEEIDIVCNIIILKYDPSIDIKEMIGGLMRT